MNNWQKKKRLLEEEETLDLQKIKLAIEKQEATIDDYQKKFNQLMSDFYQFNQAQQRQQMNEVNVQPNETESFTHRSRQVVADFEQTVYRMRQKIEDSREAKSAVAQYYQQEDAALAAEMTQDNEEE